MVRNSTKIQEIYARLEREEYDIATLEPYDALLILDAQIDAIFDMCEHLDDLNLIKLIPREKLGYGDDYDYENAIGEDIGIVLKLNSKLKNNFEDLGILESNSSNNNKLNDLSISMDDSDIDELTIMSKMAARKELMKKFCLKAVPSLGVSDYLERIHKHCPLSTGAILTCCVYISNLVLGTYYDSQQLKFNRLKILPLDKFNCYRVILTALRVSLKFMEDKNLKIANYCRIVGLNVREYRNLELNFMFLIDFRFYVNAVVLKDHLRFMNNFNTFISLNKKKRKLSQ